MKYEKIAIFLTLLCLWGTQFLVELQLELALLFVLSVGIWHGSNDIDLIRHVSRKRPIGSSFFALAIYILTVGVGTVLFLTLPELALLVFVLFSAYHFGEQHWLAKYNKFRRTTWTATLTDYLVPLTYGLLILSMIFYWNQAETNQVLFNLIGTGFTSGFYLGLFLSSAVLLMTGALFLLLADGFRLLHLFYEIFLIVLLGIIFNYANLVWGFAIYFVIWHSLPSIQDQLRFLYGQVSLNKLLLYCKSSWWIWSISVGGLMLLWGLVGKDETLRVPLLFGMLGAVTFSHTLIITLMKRVGKQA